jgi:hypothetical protein
VLRVLTTASETVVLPERSDGSLSSCQRQAQAALQVLLFLLAFPWMHGAGELPAVAERSIPGTKRERGVHRCLELTFSPERPPAVRVGCHD